MRFKIKRDIKQEISAGTNKDDLTLFILPENNNHTFKWIENGKEFRYQGDMFDVVKIRIKDHKKYIYCLNDIKEKQLITKYLKTQKSKKKSEKIHRRNDLITKYVPSSVILNFNLNTTEFINKTWHYIYQSNIPNIPSPPPKQA